MFSTIYEDFFVNVRTGDLTRSYIIVALLIVVGLAIVFFTTFVQQAEYQIANSIYEIELKELQLVHTYL
jgi:preprotein translocase subunit SecY